MSERFDVCVVGGGLIGLSTARSLTQMRDGISILVLEKEHDIATHQSGHNSGVVHSGLYYRPGSLKARLCVEGREQTYALCEEAGIAFKRSGKLVVATDRSQVPALEQLERRGRANGLLGIERIDRQEITSIEPQATGLEALWIPESGVVDFALVARHHATVLETYGATTVTDSPVTEIDHEPDGVAIHAGDQVYRARTLVNCAGLQSDLVARLAGIQPEVRIIPFRGEYYRLRADATSLVKGLIYPVPDPRFPFLGVHFTRRVDESVEVGPNAVLAIGREHYRDARPDWSEFRAIVGHPGFRRLAARHWYAGMKEMVNSRFKSLYARQAQKLVPGLKSVDLIEGGAGIRAQAVDRSGRLLDDFVIEQAGATIHVLNAPSPGATASMAIGRHVADRLTALLGG